MTRCDGSIYQLGSRFMASLDGNALPQLEAILVIPGDQITIRAQPEMVKPRAVIDRLHFRAAMGAGTGRNVAGDHSKNNSFH
jgi:hypothetical protein